MRFLVTACTLLGFLLPLAGLAQMILPSLRAGIIALFKRDPGAAWVPDRVLRRARLWGGSWIALGVLLLIAIQPRFFRTPVTPPGLADSSDSSLRAIVAREVIPLIESGRCLGITVGVVDGSRRFVLGMGRSSLDRRVPPDGSTVYEIGAITQVFTALVLARLAEQGVVRLDQPVQELLSDSVSVPMYGEDPILLEDLATHRSALPRLPTNLGFSPFNLIPALADPWAAYTTRKLDQFLTGYQLERPPGTKVEYSDLGMGLLGHALQRATHATFEDLVRREICEPLGLADTRVRLTPAMRNRLARGCVVGKGNYRGWRVVSPAHPSHSRALAGAACLHSTADDLLTFLKAQLGLMPGALSAAMDSTRRPRHAASAEMDVGLGWFTLYPRGGDAPIVWQHGSTTGFRSYIGLVERRGLGVVVLANTAADVDSVGMRILMALMRRRPAPPA